MKSPPPFKCQSGTGQENFAGHWDSSGRLVIDAEYANAAGRTDIEGCCWWGRGALLTRGICQIGKINYYLGKRGAELGRSTLYPKLDFCQYPEVTCTSTNGDQIRWTTAMFQWSEQVQRYQESGWNFKDQLSQFVEGGMTSDSFITGVSRILSRGCHEYGCSGIGEVRMLNQRVAHFFMIINDVFDLKSAERPKATPQPTTWFFTQQPMQSISPTPGLPAGMPTPQIATTQPIINTASSIGLWSRLSSAKQMFQLSLFLAHMYYHIIT